MAQWWAKGFYASTVWKKQRNYILQRDHHICTEPGCRRVATEVHHIIPLTKDNINDLSICLSEKNLRSLCHECHERITVEMNTKGYGVLKRIAFDEKGYPVEAD